MKKTAFAALNQHLEQHAGDLLENCRQIQETLTKMDWASIASDNDKMVKRVLRFVWGVFNTMRDMDRGFCEKSVQEVANVFAVGLDRAHDDFQRHAAYLKEQRDSDLEQAHVAAALAVQAEQIKWAAERDMWVQRAVHSVETKYEERVKVMVVEHTKSYEEVFLRLNSSEASLKKVNKDLAQAGREKTLLEQGIRELEKEVQRLQVLVAAAETKAAAVAASASDASRALAVAAAPAPAPRAPPPAAAAAPKPVLKIAVALQSDIFNEKEFKQSVLADYEVKLQRVKNDFISRHEVAMRIVVQEKDAVISQLSEQLAASQQSLQEALQKHSDAMARIADLLKSNADMRARLLEAQQQQRPGAATKPPRDLSLSLFTQFQPPVTTVECSTQCEQAAEVKPKPVSEKKPSVVLRGASCQTDALIVPVSPRGHESLGMDCVMQWAATQTLDSDAAQLERQKNKSLTDGLRSTIKKLEGDVASQQMLCESLAKSFADQISVVRRFGDVHTGSSSSACGRPHLCILCFRHPVKSVSFPCGHSAICNRCRTMHALDRCPQCAPPLQLQAAVKHMEALGGAASWQCSAAGDSDAGAGSADAKEHVPAIHPQIMKLLPPDGAWLAQQRDGAVLITGWNRDDVKSGGERPTAATSSVFPDASVLTSASSAPLMFSTTPTRMVRVLAGRTAAGKVQATLPAPTAVSSESPFKVTSVKRNQLLTSMVQSGIAAASVIAPIDIPLPRPRSAQEVKFDAPSPAPAHVSLLKRPSSAAPKARS